MAKRSITQHVEIVAFTGTEESGVLHAAGDWMKDHPTAQIRGLNLHAEDVEGPGDARTWVLEMAVDHTAARVSPLDAPRELAAERQRSRGAEGQRGSANDIRNDHEG
ncbi:MULTISPECIES: hypothetical protein [Streptomyces]|uniref:hypothetical protein n=1 Tax=Streptomyces TaxID=1883 RepID=UPI00069BEBA1|nr:hypothetical protein [Streptomyces sp. SID7805]MYU54131.1 hypothetical protein [Streptomyces sp. SID7805]